MSQRPVLMIALIIMIIIAIITVAVFVFIRNQVESQEAFALERSHGCEQRPAQVHAKSLDG